MFGHYQKNTPTFSLISRKTSSEDVKKIKIESLASLSEML